MKTQEPSERCRKYPFALGSFVTEENFMFSAIFKRQSRNFRRFSEPTQLPGC
jgi:hypothetical protein